MRSITKVPDKGDSRDVVNQAVTVIIKAVQRDHFSKELHFLYKGAKISKQSTLWKLTPIVDEDGLVRVGGQISSTDTSWEERHPLIIQKKHHIATLLIRHYHEQVAHQGRHFTGQLVYGLLEARDLCLV